MRHRSSSVMGHFKWPNMSPVWRSQQTSAMCTAVVESLLYRPGLHSNVLFVKHRGVVMCLLDTGQARYTQLALHMNINCKGHSTSVVEAATTWPCTHVGKPPCCTVHVHVGKPPCCTDHTWGCYLITLSGCTKPKCSLMCPLHLFTLIAHVARRFNCNTPQPVPFQDHALCQAHVSNRP